MTTVDWALLGLAAVFVLLVGLRRKPVTAKEIAKEVVVAQAEAETQAKATATKDCGRCHRRVPAWFAEAILGEEICYACSEGKPYPAHGDEDAYVEAWRASKNERDAEDREFARTLTAEPKSIHDEPPRGDT